MEIRASQAEQAYKAAKPATAATGPEGEGPGAAFEAVVNDFTETLRNGEEVAKAAMVGEADPHALVMALTQTELAVETATTLRDKVVEAYQEILRMPV